MSAIPEALRTAFKEWAVVCRALSSGRQTVILRKGGIHEQDGEFVPEHRHFWLYPTYLHQRPDGVKPWALPLPEDDAPPGELRFDLIAEVTQIDYATDPAALAAIRDRHVWSDATADQRFHYRRPGLYVLTVRAWRVPEPLQVPLDPAFDGCKTWVDLGLELPTAGAVPVG